MFGRDEKVPGIRLTSAQYIILGIFLVLAYGLWRLQVMQSDYYSLAAERNRIRNVPVLAPRGKILDRQGRVIVDNYPSFSALLLRVTTAWLLFLIGGSALSLLFISIRNAWDTVVYIIAGGLDSDPPKDGAS